MKYQRQLSKFSEISNRARQRKGEAKAETTGDAGAERLEATDRSSLSISDVSQR